jgi:acetyl-CoA C-acetyltransferase
MSDVFLLSAARTAIGGFGGSLKDYQPGELGAVALRAAIERANVDAAQIGHVVMGTVIPTEPRDAYASRIAAVGAGIPHETPHSTSTACAVRACRRSFRRLRPFCWAIAAWRSAAGQKS